MNKTRKEIISIIGDYMDKTLSEGCLVNIDGNDKIEIYDRTLEGYEIDKILGHYDITAVLKYIGQFFDVLEFNKDFIWIAKNYKNLSEGKFEFKIPHKSLHLYSEQEEKDLLELLNKLGKQ